MKSMVRLSDLPSASCCSMYESATFVTQYCLSKLATSVIRQLQRNCGVGCTSDSLHSPSNTPLLP
jgi:hypothetical protein